MQFNLWRANQWESIDIASLAQLTRALTSTLLPAWSSFYLSFIYLSKRVVCVCVTLPPTVLLSYPCLCMRITNLDRVHQLIYISSHSPPSLRKYKWHPGILPGKMLQRYSVCLRNYSWFMKYYHPKLASVDVIASDVGMRQQAFLASLPGKAQSEIYR